MTLPRLGEIGTRNRIVDLLRRSPQTPNELADHLGVTHNAVRGHLRELTRLGVVRKAGLQRGATRPAVMYELVPGAESLFSKAYVPFVAHLLKVLRERMPPDRVDELMRTVGQRLALEWPRPAGSLRKRVDAGVTLLAELGALTESEKADGGFIIRGHGCLLSEAVHGRPEVCRAVESLLAEFLQAEVEECCDRSVRPRCCFIIH